MAKMRVDFAMRQFREITGFTLSSDGWAIVTKTDSRKFQFRGKPLFAENAEETDMLAVDIRRGIIILPPIMPIPIRRYYPDDKDEDRGREVD